MTRILFFGTPAFSVPFFEGLIKDPLFEIAAVITQPDRPAGRSGMPTPPAVKIAAEAHGIPVWQPTTLRTSEVAERMKAFGAELFVVVAYGKLIPAEILAIPPRGCVNVHPSFLPEYRGPSPMQWAIMQGDDQTGVSIMLLDEGMDTGPLLATESITIDGEETLRTLSQKVHKRGVPLLIDTLHRYIHGEITPIHQAPTSASPTRLLTREDGHIDWQTWSAVEIDRRLRAFEGWPGAWTSWSRAGKDVRIKLLQVSLKDVEAKHPPGFVYREDGSLCVDTIDGTLILEKVQLEGKPAQDVEALLPGYPDLIGTTFTTKTDTREN